MLNNTKENLNGIDLTSSNVLNTNKVCTVVGIFQESRLFDQGRYVPPHERRMLQQQQQLQQFQQEQPRRQFLSPNTRQNQPSPGSLGSFSSLGNSGSKWGSGRSTSSGMPTTRSNLGSSGSKWGAGGNLQYGPDGLFPPNKRLEEELFDGIVNSGLNFEKYDNIQIQTLGENVPSPISSFEECDLGAVLVCILSRLSSIIR